MKKSLPGQQNHFEAFIKAAQYLAGLTARQDIWSETGKVLVNFFGAVVGAVEERRANGEAAGHRWVFSERYAGRRDLETETREAIAEVLESGFLSERIILTPDPLSIACFPITRGNQVVAVMVVGHGMPGPLPRELLNVYLAVAGLVGTIGERVASERELRRHRRQLEEEIAERRRAEEKIRTALAEKELLLKEVHHRVKNNMQIISTLLDLQSENIKDERIISSFRESQDRIKAMALIHERLYESSDIASIDFQRYIGDLSTHLFDSYLVDPERIALRINAEGVSMNIDRAIPCGLIINELVTNSFKHAFPENRQGEIRVEFQRGEEGNITLRVEDNGIGLPPGLDFTRTRTLGLQLVTMLVRQLRGEVRIEGGQRGTAFIISFPGSRSE